MPENAKPANAEKPEDESVLSLQQLEGADEEPEVEAHQNSNFSIGCEKAE